MEMTIAAGDHGISSQPPSNLLAPGFRFHPTDEELVSYYLKRKVSGRPLRVDPISEVDLYKCEPWDLPLQSRIRSRDMEWYFFSPLDRKYANRSRTNRATSQGYWKTTGKDRQVRRGDRTVGMKKTLVFHAGRAPRGQRTNWVMHEYRLEGENLPSSIPQDSYVVCRIFQKNGPGPQNGAQYGAPFVEEDWEEDVEGDDHLAVHVGNHDASAEAAGNQGYFLLTDFSENDENGSQQENHQQEITEELATEPFEHKNPAKSMDPGSFPEDLIDKNGYIAIPEVHDEILIAVGGDSLRVLEADRCSPRASDGFLELNDFINNESESYFCNEDHIDNIARINGDEVDLLANGSSILTEIDADEFFDILNEDAEQPEYLQNVTSMDLSLQPIDTLNHLPDEYPMGHTSNGNLAFYEMPGHEYPHNQKYFAQENDFLASMDDPSAVDMVDELMAFFDATDDKLHYEPSSYLENDKGLDSYTLEPPKFEQIKDQSLAGPSQATHVRTEVGASPSLSTDDKMAMQTENLSDTQMGKGLEKSFTKNLVNMLGSISSPPALAAEYPSEFAKAYAQSSATNAGGSIQVTAGMIHIRGVTLTDGGDQWSIHKNGCLDFLLSYGVSDGDIVGKAIKFEPKTNVYGGGPSVVLRGWFYVLFISALFLAATYRIGVSICSR